MNHESIWEYLTAIAMAAAGGLARLLGKKHKRAMRWTAIVGELFISAFAGMLMLLLLKVMNVQGAAVGLLCGIAGWSPNAIQQIARIAKSATGVDMSDKKEEK